MDRSNPSFLVAFRPPPGRSKPRTIERNPAKWELVRRKIARQRQESKAARPGHGFAAIGLDNATGADKTHPRMTEVWAEKTGLARPQDIDREKLFRIGPGDFGRPAAAARQSRKRARRIFIAVLGMDGFARPEREHPPRHADLLALG